MLYKYQIHTYLSMFYLKAISGWYKRLYTAPSMAFDSTDEYPCSHWQNEKYILHLLIYYQPASTNILPTLVQFIKDGININWQVCKFFFSERANYLFPDNVDIYLPVILGNTNIHYQ